MTGSKLEMASLRVVTELTWANMSAADCAFRAEVKLK